MRSDMPLPLCSGIRCILPAVALLAVLASRRIVRLRSRIVLDPADYAHYVAEFNAQDHEAGRKPDSQRRGWEWIAANVPLFDCPDRAVRANLLLPLVDVPQAHPPDARTACVLTEFLTPVGHAGPHNTISCAFGHHLAEGRWLRDQRLLDEYTRFWFRSGPNGGPAAHFHKYSSWAAAALYDRYLVTLDRDFVVDLLDDLVADYERLGIRAPAPRRVVLAIRRARRHGRIDHRQPHGEKHPADDQQLHGRQRPRDRANCRRSPAAATWRTDFDAKSEALRRKMIAALWDAKPSSSRCGSRTAACPTPAKRSASFPGCSTWPARSTPPRGDSSPTRPASWRRAASRPPSGAIRSSARMASARANGTAPSGRSPPARRSPAWPTCCAARRSPTSRAATYFDATANLRRAHQQRRQAVHRRIPRRNTGEWLITGPKAAEAADYNHSTFCDLVITGLVGLVPRDDDRIEVDPLLPADAWDWFCLDGCPTTAAT